MAAVPAARRRSLAGDWREPCGPVGRHGSRAGQGNPASGSAMRSPSGATGVTCAAGSGRRRVPR
ncbi:MAG: hypothetical protein ACRDP7_28040, partial [Trebonia sp.]